MNDALRTFVGIYPNIYKTESIMPKQALFISFFMLFSWSVWGEVVRFEFAGELNNAYGTALAGSRIEGALQYDADVTPASIGGLGNPNRYSADTLIISLSIAGDLVTATGGGDQFFLEIGNDSEFGAQPGQTVDTFNMGSANIIGGSVSGTVGGLSVGWVQLLFVDSTASMFNDQTLPREDDFLLADFAQLWIAPVDTAFGNGAHADIGPVPLPGTLVLFTTALLATGAGLRRRRTAGICNVAPNIVSVN